MPMGLPRRLAVLTAIIAVGTSVTASTSLPKVLAIIVCPETSADG